MAVLPNVAIALRYTLSVTAILAFHYAVLHVQLQLQSIAFDH